MTFAIELLLSLDHKRLDDCQSLGARTAAAQKKVLCVCLFVGVLGGFFFLVWFCWDRRI